MAANNLICRFPCGCIGIQATPWRPHPDRNRDELVADALILESCRGDGEPTLHFHDVSRDSREGYPRSNNGTPLPPEDLKNFLDRHNATLADGLKMRSLRSTLKGVLS